MTPNEAIKLSLAAGEIMLSNGAETYRVEDTMRRMLLSCGYHAVEAYSVTTGIFVCVTADGADITSFRRITKRTMNIDAVIRINELSRALAEERVTPAEVFQQIEELKNRRNVNDKSFIKLFAAGITAGAFTFLFGGSIFDCLNAFFTGFILQILLFQLRKVNVSAVLTHIIGGIMITFVVLAMLNLGVGSSYHPIIIGSLMLLVPGITLANAVRDILTGDYLSGTVRLMDAFIVALSLAAGVGISMRVWFHFFGGAYI